MGKIAGKFMNSRYSSSTSPLLLCLLFYLYMPQLTPSPSFLHHIYPETQSTIFSICFSSIALSLAILLHLNKKCYCAQTLSSLYSPTHLPDSTLSSAIPPLCLAKICLRLFLSNCTHLNLHPLPISLCSTPSFDLSFASHNHSFLTSLYTKSFNI